MNVLHISESDVGGGAARTAYKLHRGLGAAGHESRMLVGRKLTTDEGVRGLKRNAAWRAADRLAIELLDRQGLQYAFYPSSFGVARNEWFRAADVLQLHNLHGSYFSFTALPRLTRARPAVWVLQDQWPMTGHVAYSLDCDRWRHGCGDCPRLGDHPALRRDTTAALWKLKHAVYRRSRLTLVVPSRWMERLVGESPLLRRFPVVRIPHGVDTTVFRPMPKDEARRRLGLPADGPLVLFSAYDLNEPRKGLHLLVEALSRMDSPPALVLAGAGEAPGEVRAHALGRIDDDARLAAVYAAADVLVMPTLADALTQNTLESLATGTPCVTFDQGGVADVVAHGETGYQARYADVDDLARGIARMLEPSDGLADRCRDAAVRDFSVDLQVARYAELYERVVQEAAQGGRNAPGPSPLGAGRADSSRHAPKQQG